MELVEREAARSALRERLDAARRGHGSVVLVAAEAGLGKTSLLRAAAEDARSVGVVVQWGGCDPLVTPRSLGPLWDIAPSAPGIRAALSAPSSRHDVFTAVLES